MRIFGKNKKEKGQGTGDNFSGTVSGGGGEGGVGGVLHISIVGDGMDYLHFPPTENPYPLPSVIVLPRRSFPVCPSLRRVRGHSCHFPSPLEALGESRASSSQVALLAPPQYKYAMHQYSPMIDPLVGVGRGRAVVGIVGVGRGDI